MAPEKLFDYQDSADLIQHLKAYIREDAVAEVDLLLKNNPALIDYLNKDGQLDGEHFELDRFEPPIMSYCTTSVMLKTLLDAGIDPLKKDWAGQSAFESLLSLKNTDMAESLLKLSLSLAPIEQKEIIAQYFVYTLLNVGRVSNENGWDLQNSDILSFLNEIKTVVPELWPIKHLDKYKNENPLNIALSWYLPSLVIVDYLLKEGADPHESTPAFYPGGPSIAPIASVAMWGEKNEVLCDDMLKLFFHYHHNPIDMAQFKEKLKELEGFLKDGYSLNLLKKLEYLEIESEKKQLENHIKKIEGSKITPGLTIPSFKI